MSERDNLKLLYTTLNEDKSCPHGDLMDAIIDRQGRMEDEYRSEIRDHMKNEDDFKREMTDRFKAGDDRMSNIETDIGSLKNLVAVFDGFRKSLNIIATMGGAIMLLFLWILLEKNADIKATQDTLLKHSVALEKLVYSHQELEKDVRRELDRIHK